tara:strand:+ start:104 stop:859 length:756 start_codon:yes stop_codon:yes gene_type:complete
MSRFIQKDRVEKIITFLKSLKINSHEFSSILKNKDIEVIKIFDEAFTHSSANKNINYEKLEFFGDAVLRLTASQFIDKNFINMSVGKRSELRAQIVSDEWLTKLGKVINIEQLIIIGSKAMGDYHSKDRIIAETTEALIGALYKSCRSIHIINLWLDEYWEGDAKSIINEPHKFNAKTLLQEWCQERGLDLPEYKIKEQSTLHGDPERFFCELYINGIKYSSSYGQSHKKAEKTAAAIAIEKVIKPKIKAD